MSKAMGNNNEPFGGINIICTSDFAQLPSVDYSFTLYNLVCRPLLCMAGTIPELSSFISNIIKS